MHPPQIIPTSEMKEFVVEYYEGKTLLELDISISLQEVVSEIVDLLKIITPYKFEFFCGETQEWCILASQEDLKKSDKLKITSTNKTLNPQRV